MRKKSLKKMGWWGDELRQDMKKWEEKTADEDETWWRIGDEARGGHRWDDKGGWRWHKNTRSEKKMGQNKQNFFFYLTIWKKMWRSIKRQGEKRIDETRQRQEVHWYLFSSLSPALLCITAHWDTFTQTRWSWAGAQMINGVNAMTSENLSARPYPGQF